MTQQQPAVIFIMGPTASGKTALALALARRFPIEIISVDSALVYRILVPPSPRLMNSQSAHTISSVFWIPPSRILQRGSARMRCG